MHITLRENETFFSSAPLRAGVSHLNIQHYTESIAEFMIKWLIELKIFSCPLKRSSKFKCSRTSKSGLEICEPIPPA